MRPYWQRDQDSKAWLRRWEEKRRRAFDSGKIDHTKDKSAPWSHPAHYGYLVPLRGAALEAYKGWKIRTGNPESSDAVRWAFEDWYIGICRGITQISARGYFSGAEKCVIYFVVNRFQIPKVKHLVTTIDPAAFITVTEISDVMGTSVKQK